MTTTNELEIIKIIEENGWNIKELAQKVLELNSMVDQLLEKIEKLKKQLEEVENEESQKPTKSSKEPKD